MPSLLQEIGLLRLQVRELQERDVSGGVLLQRFLDESATYTESIVSTTELQSRMASETTLSADDSDCGDDNIGDFDKGEDDNSHNVSPKAPWLQIPKESEKGDPGSNENRSIPPNHQNPPSPRNKPTIQEGTGSESHLVGSRKSTKAVSSLTLRQRRPTPSTSTRERAVEHHFRSDETPPAPSKVPQLPSDVPRPFISETSTNTTEALLPGPLVEHDALRPLDHIAMARAFQERQKLSTVERIDCDRYFQQLFFSKWRGSILQRFGTISEIQAALDRGAAVNSYINVGPHSETPLYRACDEFLRARHRRFSDVIVLLLERGADVNAKGGHFGSPLQAVSWACRFNLVKLLLSHGADVNAQNGVHGTALQAASMNKYSSFNVVQLLLSHGADVNAQGGRHGTALQAASYFGLLDIVELLIKHGANPNARGGGHQSPLNAARIGMRRSSRKKSYRSVMALLKEHGASD